METLASLWTTTTSAACGVLALALAAVLCFGVASLTKPRPPDARAPIAHGGLPLVGHTLLVLKNAQRAHDWINDFCQTFKEKPFRLVLFGGFSLTVLNTPALYEDVLKTQFERFPKGPQMCENLDGLLGSGIFAVDGVQWMHQRKTASNLFTTRSLRDSMAYVVQELVPTMERILERAADSHAQIDLFKLFNRFTMEAFAKIGFGINLNCLDADADHPFMEAFDTAQRMVTLRFVVPRFVWKLQRWLNIGSESELRVQTKAVNDTVLDIISCSLKHRQERGFEGRSVDGDDRMKDIVSLFLDDVSQDEKRDDEPFDPVFLRDIVVNFLIAGRDTTAQALSWFFVELSQNPHVETRVREELQHELPHLFEDSPTLPTMEQVQKLPYLEAALLETLRLHPSVPINFKTAIQDTVLSDGTFIPKDSAVCIPSYSLGRAKHVWGEYASEFRPERWIDPHDPQKLRTVSAYQFSVFHAGPRTCLGMNLAMMEMKIVVASVVSKFHVAVVAGQNPTQYDLSLTLPVKGELLTSVERT